MTPEFGSLKQAQHLLKMWFQGLNVISGPIKIIIITASIVGGIILLLIAYKYIHKNVPENVEINLVTRTQTYPHIWKYHDAYYKDIISTN